MIKLTIHAEGKQVADSFTKRKTTLIENALVLRRLEEIKQVLLNMEYEADFKVSKEDGE
jgi:hypothetical protein